MPSDAAFLMHACLLLALTSLAVAGVTKSPAAAASSAPGSLEAAIQAAVKAATLKWKHGERERRVVQGAHACACLLNPSMHVPAACLLHACAYLLHASMRHASMFDGPDTGMLGRSCIVPDGDSVVSTCLCCVHAFLCGACMRGGELISRVRRQMFPADFVCATARSLCVP